MSFKKINIDKKYLEKILKPINKLNESCCLKIKDDILYSVTASEDSSVFLYAKLKLPFISKDQVRLNIINIKKFLSGLEILGDDGDFNLYLEENHIKCETEKNSEKCHFIYHLVDDSIIKEFPFNISKFNNIKFDSEFSISPEKAKKILAASSFASEAQKIYFEFDENNIFVDVNDLSRQNIDSIKIPISNDLVGENIFKKIPISLEIFKNISFFKDKIKIKINKEFDLIVFNIFENDCLELKYIVSALIK